MIAYHEARAEAGVGMITMEVSTVHRELCAPRPALGRSPTTAYPASERMAAMGKRHDCRVLGQLFHPGRVAAASEDGSAMASYAPIRDARRVLQERPHAADERSRSGTSSSTTAAGAARMAEGGLDGIELISSMGYLVSQFLNPRLNLRDDEFGGSFDKRCGSCARS